jgi:hypothetical protein
MADSSALPGWTEHNVHDPGVMLLRVLVYTLGAVALVLVSAAVVRSRRGAGDCD